MHKTNELCFCSLSKPSGQSVLLKLSSFKHNWGINTEPHIFTIFLCFLQVIWSRVMQVRTVCLSWQLFTTYSWSSCQIAGPKHFFPLLMFPGWIKGHVTWWKAARSLHSSIDFNSKDKSAQTVNRLTRPLPEINDLLNNQLSLSAFNVNELKLTLRCDDEQEDAWYSLKGGNMAGSVQGLSGFNWQKWNALDS